MRIGFDGRSLDSPAGGVRRYAGELLNGLIRVNPNNQLTVFGASSGAMLPAAAQRLPVARTAPTNLGWSLVDLPRVARRERLDIFHSPAYTAPLHSVHPLALTIHDVSYERHPEWYPYRRDPLRRWFYRRSARTADLIITDSEFSRAEISAAYDIDATLIKVVPLGVAAPFVGATRQPLPAAVIEPYLLHVGDLHPRRNLRLVVRALADVARHSENRVTPMLVLAGADRGERAVLEDDARRAHVRVQFAGMPDDNTLASLYAGATAFVYPSRYEGFGLPLLEAMAAGAPVLAALASSIPDVVGDAGILVDPDDENELAVAIARVMDDSALANLLRDAGRKRAAAFTWDRTAELTLEAYHAAVGHTR